MVVLSNRHAGWAFFPAHREDSHTEIDSSQQVTWGGTTTRALYKDIFVPSGFFLSLPHFYICLSVPPFLSPSRILFIPPSQRAHMFPLYIPGQSSLLAQNMSIASPNIEPDANVNRSVFLMPCVWGLRWANLIGVKRSGSFCLDLNTHTHTDPSHQRSVHVFQTSTNSEMLCYCFLIQSRTLLSPLGKKNPNENQKQNQNRNRPSGCDDCGADFLNSADSGHCLCCYLQKESLDMSKLTTVSDSSVLLF